MTEECAHRALLFNFTFKVRSRLEEVLSLETDPVLS